MLPACCKGVVGEWSFVLFGVTPASHPLWQIPPLVCDRLSVGNVGRGPSESLSASAWHRVGWRRQVWNIRQSPSCYGVSDRVEEKDQASLPWPKPHPSSVLERVGWPSGSGDQPNTSESWQRFQRDRHHVDSNCRRFTKRSVLVSQSFCSSSSWKTRLRNWREYAISSSIS